MQNVLCMKCIQSIRNLHGYIINQIYPVFAEFEPGKGFAFKVFTDEINMVSYMTKIHYLVQIGMFKLGDPMHFFRTETRV